MDANSSLDYDYLVSPSEEDNYLIKIRMMYIIGYLIICPLGVVLNLMVIIAGIYYHCKSATAKWVLALAVTHLIYSAFLPLQILYSWYHFNWHYGTALCKLSSYVFYVSMFSTAGILSLWSVTDWTGRIQCKAAKCITFQQSAGVLIMILCTWTFAVVLSVPSLYSRELQYTSLGRQCVDDYDFTDTATTTHGKTIHTIVVCYRFILGILVPAFLIGICCRCQRNEMERNLTQMKCLIKLSYFVCWTPLLIMGLLQNIYSVSNGLPVATVLAAAHCCINPVVYLLSDFTMKWMKQT